MLHVLYMYCMCMKGCFWYELHLSQRHATMKLFIFPCYAQTAETQTIKETSTGCKTETERNTNMEVLRAEVRGRTQGRQEKDMHVDRGR